MNLINGFGRASPGFSSDTPTGSDRARGSLHSMVSEPRGSGSDLPIELDRVGPGKVVIHQNGVVWHQLHKNHRGSNFAMQEDFARQRKFR